MMVDTEEVAVEADITESADHLPTTKTDHVMIDQIGHVPVLILHVSFRHFNQHFLP